MNTLPERRKQTHVTDSSASAVTHPAWVVFLPRTSDCLPDPDLPFGMTTGGFPGPPARAIPLPAGVSLDTQRACGDEGAKTRGVTIQMVWETDDRLLQMDPRRGWGARRGFLSVSPRANASFTRTVGRALSLVAEGHPPAGGCEEDRNMSGPMPQAGERGCRQKPQPGKRRRESQALTTLCPRCPHWPCWPQTPAQGSEGLQACDPRVDPASQRRKPGGEVSQCPGPGLGWLLGSGDGSGGGRSWG